MPPRLFLTTAIFGLLAGCVSTPDVGPNPVPVAAESLASDASFADANGAWPVDGWWQAMGDAYYAVFSLVVIGAMAGNALLQAQEQCAGQA